MINKLEITPEAERDIFTIVYNIQLQISNEAAMRVVTDLKKQINKLVELPNVGRAGACKATREVVMTGLPYIAIYEKNNSSITIVRVLHGAEERTSATE